MNVDKEIRDHVLELCSTPEQVSRSIAGDVQYNHEARPHRYAWDTIGLMLGHEPYLPHDQYLHFPSWIAYLVDPRKTSAEEIEKTLNQYKIASGRTGICSVTTHGGHDDIRGRFIRNCSGITNGGFYYNTVGGPVACKSQFIQRYKYHVCIENDTSLSGYVTEKLPHAIQVGCIPIYDTANFSEFEDAIFNRAAIIEPGRFDHQDVRAAYFLDSASRVIAGRIAELKDKLRNIIR